MTARRKTVVSAEGKATLELRRDYLAFHLEFPRDRAMAIFEERFGHKAAGVVMRGPWYYLGPCRENP